MGTLQKHHSKLLLITAHSYIFVEKKEKYPQFLDEKKCLIWSCVCSLLISSSACKELVHYQVGCLIKTCVSRFWIEKRLSGKTWKHEKKIRKYTYKVFREKNSRQVSAIGALHCLYQKYMQMFSYFSINMFMKIPRPDCQNTLSKYDRRCLFWKVKK